jgi:hypothetical protein
MLCSNSIKPLYITPLYDDDAKLNRVPVAENVSFQPAMIEGVESKNEAAFAPCLLCSRRCPAL